MRHLQTVAKGTLKSKIDRLIGSPTVSVLLKAQGVSVVDVSTLRPTETTQRWKIGLQAGRSTIRTKVEFSRRGPVVGAAFDTIDREIGKPYGQIQFAATHYAAAAATTQKIRALAGSQETQARDVFDLNLLFSRPELVSFSLSHEEKRKLSSAIENGISISFADYTSQVVAFLGPGQQALYRSRDTWNTMQAGVVERLEALR